MKRLYSWQSFGNSILLAGLIIFPLALSGTAKTENATEYQIGRHDVTKPSPMKAVKDNKMMSYNAMGGGEIQQPKTNNPEAMNDYQRGRH